LSQPSSGGLPKNNLWLLIEKEGDAMKGIVRNIKFPIDFVQNLKNILIREGNFDGGRMHD
jgi:hypothetical protein